VAGRSAFPEPFDMFGVDLGDYDAAFSEKLDLLRGAHPPAGFTAVET